MGEIIIYISAGLILIGLLLTTMPKDAMVKTGFIITIVGIIFPICCLAILKINSKSINDSSKYIIITTKEVASPTDTTIISIDTTYQKIN